MKITTKIRLLTMSKADKEKKLDELNQKLRITHLDSAELEEREWLKNKLRYKT